jgi:hypothetical protein
MLLKKISVVVLVTVAIFNYAYNVQAAESTKDFNGDGVIDKLDSDVLKENYNLNKPEYDITGDGIVDIYDMVQITKNINLDFQDNNYISIGNTMDNLLNSSFAVIRDGIIYYRNTQDGNNLYKSMINRDGKIKLSSDAVTSINLIGDKLYYSNMNDGGKIYRIDTDGTGRTLVVSDAGGDFIVSGGFIYYKRITDGNKLYRISLNDNSKSKLSDHSIDKFVVKSGYIYYINNSDSGRLYKVALNGTGTARISSDVISNFAMEKGYIYYVNNTDNNRIYSMDLNGAERKILVSEATINLNVYQGFIYYSTASDGRLYKVKTDGTENVNIQQERLSINKVDNKLSVSAGWIFYTNAADGNRLYRIQTDGNSKRDMDTVVEARVNTSSLNFRTLPCVSAVKLPTLVYGTKVEILATIIHEKHQDIWEPTTWYKIAYTNNGVVTTGYVASSYLLIINDDRQESWLGVLSGKYESNGDPGTVSNLAGDRGGKSYGAWQFASNMGTVDSFIFWLYDRNENFYNMLTAAKSMDGGSFGTNFDTAWKKLAKDYTDEFLNLQHDYIQIKYYDEAVRYVKNNFNGFDINSKSFAYRNVVWSTAVQHGVMGAVRKVDANSTLRPGVLTVVGYTVPEREFIDLAYKERSKLDIYFSSYDPNYVEDKKILDGLTLRFTNEDVDALRTYDYGLQQ